MNKQDLTMRLSNKLKISQRMANDAIDTVVDEITLAVKKNQKVTLVGFGTFYKAARKARMGRNPQNGARIRIAARNIPRFRAGDAFKKAVK